VTLRPTAALYDAPLLYDAEFGLYRADVPFYGYALRRSAGRPVELGCGTGRLFFGLKKPAGYVGVDASGPMLSRFRSKLAGELQAGTVLIRGALGQVPLVSGSASLVILAYNLLQHLTTVSALEQALADAGRLAGSSGLVALDTFVAMPVQDWRNDDDFGWPEKRQHPHGGVLFVSERVRSNTAQGVQELSLRFCSRSDALAGDERRVIRRLWTTDELQRAAGQAGLRVNELWGDVDGSAWTPHSPRFMAICAGS
jgi:SAM-dependent methyltransferase